MTNSSFIGISKWENIWKITMFVSHIPIAALGTFVSAYAQSDFFGKLIILGLLFLSIICWIVLIQKIWQTRKTREISLAFQKKVQNNRHHLLQLEIEDLPKTTYVQIPHPFALIFSELKTKTTEILNKNHYFASQSERTSQVYLSPTDIESVEAHVLTSISTQSKRLEKNLFVLSTIVTLAPFIGLLGTVWGILVTFGELNTSGSIASNSAILGGISTALVTTVMGLLIAIPALIAYNYLRTTLKNYNSDMEDFLYQLLSDVELQYRKVDIN